jgi:hypothetical protein
MHTDTSLDNENIPPSFLTADELQRWTELQEDKIDAQRKERELLLGMYAQRPPNWQPEPPISDAFEQHIAEYTSEERAGLLLLDVERFSQRSELLDQLYRARIAQLNLVHHALVRLQGGESS